MKYKEEQQFLSFYIHRLVKSSRGSGWIQKLYRWIDENIDDLREKKQIAKIAPDGLYKTNTDSFSCDGQSRKKLLLSVFCEKSRPSGEFMSRINLIKSVFKLNNAESELLCLLGLTMVSSVISDMFFYSFDRGDLFERKYASVLGCLIGASELETEKLFDVNENLVSKGLIIIDDFEIRPSDSFKRIFSSNVQTTEELFSVVLEEKAQSSLGLDDFGYLKKDIEYAKNLLFNALKSKECGINLVLYGKPGTGKTELAKTLAQSVGANLYMLSENKADSSRDSRISELCAAKSLLDGVPNSLIMMDEAEDIFYETKWDKSKIFFNRLLEKNTTPIIWITNRIEYIDPAFLRRFSYAINVDVPKKGDRESIWRKIAEKHNVSLSGERIKQLASDYSVPPALIESSMRYAGLTKDQNAIERTINSIEQASGKLITQTGNKNAQFHTELLNTDVDLRDFADRISNKGNMAFSMCLYGVPGTGKSAFGRYLADRLGLEIVYKKASDLLNCFVGKTEEAIAEAFRQAATNEALLIIDEADSFLSDRNMASRMWESTMVNEMLCQMERHKYPFICTTNLIDKLDKAALRRFTFKVKYDFLTLEQVVCAFRIFLGIELKIQDVAHLTMLAPSDFVSVKAQADILGIQGKDGFIAMLEKEQSVKSVKKTAKIGF